MKKTWNQLQVTQTLNGTVEAQSQGPLLPTPRLLSIFYISFFLQNVKHHPLPFVIEKGNRYLSLHNKLPETFRGLKTTCTLSVSQEPGHDLARSSSSKFPTTLQSGCGPGLGSQQGLDRGRVCVQAHVGVGSIQLPEGCRTKGLDS